MFAIGIDPLAHGYDDRNADGGQRRARLLAARQFPGSGLATFSVVSQSDLRMSGGSKSRASNSIDPTAALVHVSQRGQFEIIAEFRRPRQKKWARAASPPRSVSRSSLSE
jgi:hypothetical protein